jgi:hypothetical protein
MDLLGDAKIMERAKKPWDTMMRSGESPRRRHTPAEIMRD